MGARSRLLAAAAAAVALVAMLGAGAPEAAPPPTCNGEDVTLPATDSPDVIKGTPGRDVINAGTGDDVVNGLGGGDLICGGDGNDRLSGGDSFDALFGDDGDDVLEGGDDDDVLFVGPGLDEQTATGGAGYDVAYGDEGSETCAAEDMYVCAVTDAEDDGRLPSELPAAVPCDVVASSAGDDGNSGAPAAPFLTAERMVNALQPGETGCLAPGETFTDADQELLVRSHGEPGSPITVRTIPGGAPAKIRGRVRASATAHDVVFGDVVLDGDNTVAVLRGGGDPEAPGLASPAVEADRVAFLDLDASNATAGCFSFNSPLSGAVIARNTVHDCAGPGVLLGPGAAKVQVLKNLLERNAGAIVFEGTEQDDGSYARPHDGFVFENVIRNSELDGGEWQVEGTFAAGEDWSDNVVAENCLFQPNGMNIQDPRTAFSERDNVVAETCAEKYGPPDAKPVYPAPPAANETVNLETAARRVELKVNGSRAKTFLPLIAPAQIAVGSTVDTSRGRARLTVATGSASTATLEIRGGSVRVRQLGGAKPETELRLTGSYVGASTSGTTRKRRRRQWGKGKCRRCSIRGRYGKASQPRSEFLVEDRCTGTRVFVREGSVRFTDFVTGKTRKIKTGQSYTAKPRRRPC